MSMTIANRLKRITSKWGVESKSHTIEDVLEDLENGLPFGVKTEMVEIVPEQSVTKSTSWDDVHQKEMRGFVIEVNGNSDYLVNINGKDYKCKAEFDSVEDFQAKYKKVLAMSN